MSEQWFVAWGNGGITHADSREDAIKRAGMTEGGRAFRRVDVGVDDVLLAPSDVEKLREAGRALRDVVLALEDYSDGRMDSLVALGKIGVRLLGVDTDVLALIEGKQ